MKGTGRLNSMQLKNNNNKLLKPQWTGCFERKHFSGKGCCFEFSIVKQLFKKKSWWLFKESPKVCSRGWITFFWFGQVVTEGLRMDHRVWTLEWWRGGCPGGGGGECGCSGPLDPLRFLPVWLRGLLPQDPLGTHKQSASWSILPRLLSQTVRVRRDDAWMKCWRGNSQGTHKSRTLEFHNCS